MIVLDNKCKYLLVIRWVMSKVNEYHYFRTLDEMNNFINMFAKGSFEILYKFELKEID